MSAVGDYFLREPGIFRDAVVSVAEKHDGPGGIIAHKCARVAADLGFEGAVRILREAEPLPAVHFADIFGPHTEMEVLVFAVTDEIALGPAADEDAVLIYAPDLWIEESGPASEVLAVEELHPAGFVSLLSL